MRLPASLLETWAHEPEWLAALPRLVRECADAWELELEEPVDTPHSLVVPAGDAVLKLNAPSHFEADTEADALERWGGRGAVRAARARRRAASVPHGALPAGHAAVGRGRRRGGGRRRTAAAPPGRGAGRRIRSASSPTRRTAGPTMSRAGTTRRASRSSERCSTPRSTSTAASTGRRAYLVNQDLHGGNVLRAEREPWLVIDPKPLVGERELEAERAPAQRRLGHRGGSTSSPTLGLDRERARGWGVAHNLAWAWDENRHVWHRGARRRGAPDLQRA